MPLAGQWRQFSLLPPPFALLLSQTRTLRPKIKNPVFIYPDRKKFTCAADSIPDTPTERDSKERNWGKYFVPLVSNYSCFCHHYFFITSGCTAVFTPGAITNYLTELKNHSWSSSRPLVFQTVLLVSKHFPQKPHWHFSVTTKSESVTRLCNKAPEPSQETVNKRRTATVASEGRSDVLTDHRRVKPAVSHLN